MKISVVIPVYNEQENINQTISNLGDCEIIVSDCNGKTLSAIENHSVIKVMSETGRGSQLNTGAKAATGGVLLFLHSDTQLPDGWQKKIMKTLINADAGAFSLGIKSHKKAFRIIEFFSNIRCRFSKIPRGDQAIFMKQQCFISVNGYRDYPIFEDVAIMRAIKSKGFKISILHDKVLTSARRWEEEGIVYTTLRNWLISILYLCGVSPKTLSILYRRRHDETVS